MIGMAKCWMPLGLVAVLSLGEACCGEGGQERQAPKPWFAKVFHDEGTVFEGAKLTHLFPFKNPTEVAHRIKVMQKTCACAMAWLVWDGKEIQFDHVVTSNVVVPPGGEGAIKVLLDMTGIRGLKDGTVTMFTDDPLVPTTMVKFQATGMHYFEVLPASINLGEFSWKERKEFSFAVTSPHLKEWSIVKVDTLPEGVKLEEPVRVEEDGKIVYKIKGSMGPDLQPGPAGGTVRLHTDFKDHVIQVTLAGEVKQPYKIEPRGFFSFGLIRQAKGSPERLIEIEDQDPEHPLQLISVVLEGQNLPSKFYRVEALKGENGKIQVVVQIKPGAPQGLIRGNVVLELSHPKAPRQIIGFSASVR